jgi:hypothetical protein
MEMFIHIQYILVENLDGPVPFALVVYFLLSYCFLLEHQH